MPQHDRETVEATDLFPMVLHQAPSEVIALGVQTSQMGSLQVLLATPNVLKEVLAVLQPAWRLDRVGYHLEVAQIAHSPPIPRERAVRFHGLCAWPQALVTMPLVRWNVFQQVRVFVQRDEAALIQKIQTLYRIFGVLLVQQFISVHLKYHSLPSGTVNKIISYSNSYGKSWLIGGLEHGFYDFPYIVNFTIPTDELIFQRGRRTNHQPDNDFNG